MHIKICGIRTLDDALAAVAAGADMLGFNFYPPSPRAVDVPTCAAIVDALRSRGHAVTCVGVFVNAPPETVRATLDACGLDAAQLSGDEPPSDLTALAGRAFKAIRPRDAAEAEALAARYARAAPPPALLLDARVPGLYGGSGRPADWGLARRLAARLPLLLAGGLTPENVAAAVRAVRPWGVDVASGVESAPGVKSPPRMAAFCRAARSLPSTPPLAPLPARGEGTGVE